MTVSDLRSVASRRCLSVEPRGPYDLAAGASRRCNGGPVASQERPRRDPGRALRLGDDRRRTAKRRRFNIPLLLFCSSKSAFLTELCGQKPSPRSRFQAVMQLCLNIQETVVIAKFLPNLAIVIPKFLPKLGITFTKFGRNLAIRGQMSIFAPYIIYIPQ